jgi:NADPH:quinone reductase-like Zn-dependent oxidoreductase
MTATVVASAFGGPEVLLVIDEPTGLPGPGQVLLDVRAAGVNPVDYKVYSGAFGTDPARLPIRLGLEAAGVVSAVGAGAEGTAGPVRVGDDVIVYPVQGAYAGQVVVAASSVVPKPPSLSFEQAAGLLLAGATAVHALTAVGVGRGDTLAVHGAAGGVGIMAVQLAVDAGARVIGGAAADSRACLRELGAEPVAYGDGLVERIRALAPNGVDAAIDLVGTDEAVDASAALVADRSRLASIASFQRGAALGFKLLGAGPGADPGTAIRAAARFELVRQVEAGKLRVRVAGTYPLREAAAAHRELLSGHTHGKLVLIP